MTSTTDRAELLRATRLSRRFGERWAVRDVSFDLLPGELVAIIGPNGAGKTTLLSMLAGALPPTAGELSRPGGRVGWVPQQPAVYAKLSVAENLRLFARLEKLREPERVVERMLGQTALRERAGDEVGRLSGGNQQRVNIAIGLLCSPTVLLLDEPSSSLDPRQRERLWEFIGGLTERGTAVVVSTHNVFEAERYADRVLVLADGELLFDGTPEDLERTVEEISEDPASGTAGTPGVRPPGRTPNGGAPRPRGFEAAFVRFLHARGH